MSLRFGRMFKSKQLEREKQKELEKQLEMEREIAAAAEQASNFNMTQSIITSTVSSIINEDAFDSLPLPNIPSSRYQNHVISSSSSISNMSLNHYHSKNSSISTTTINTLNNSNSNNSNTSSSNNNSNNGNGNGNSNSNSNSFNNLNNLSNNNLSANNVNININTSNFNTIINSNNNYSTSQLHRSYSNVIHSSSPSLTELDSFGASNSSNMENTLSTVSDYSNNQLVVLKLSPAEISILRQSWNENISPPYEKVDGILQLVDEDSKINSLSEVFSSIQFWNEIQNNAFLINPELNGFLPPPSHQAIYFTGILRMAVLNSEDLSVLVDYLGGIGRRHGIIFGAEPNFFQDLGVAIMRTLNERFGEAFSPEIEHVWISLYCFLANTMIDACNIDTILPEEENHAPELDDSAMNFFSQYSDILNINQRKSGNNNYNNNRNSIVSRRERSLTKIRDKDRRLNKKSSFTNSSTNNYRNNVNGSVRPESNLTNGFF
ncbi:globin ASCRUDRAFT_10311 [Ascoidea rubescens DSM 1968]|uniref:Globin domain-containing protein n=1 Tax=Ascoidea rubescens DSM 1968 TaxID=1344418 RepID=A0A1D2V9B8_9ASCO|nr:hypothetical protein ASCRUDRAFT_10311 [Ascoidea rubescens DSM 1968]ODV58261.1 hypothetical protein ASCRUDRAFT_10311 [Ascoidea rubescens DSM 1968]